MTPEYPVAGGTALRLTALNSPNFNLQNPNASPSPSWAILQSGLAYFFGLVLSGGTITGPDYIINTSGIFIYSGTPANGNLIGSWAGTSGTDAFGNAYPQGFDITQGSISGTTFTGSDFIVNSSGAFFYSSTPAAGNLIASITGASGTDGFGNSYAKGLNSYLTVAGLSGYTYVFAIGLNQSGSIGSFGSAPGLTMQDLTTAPSAPAGVWGAASDGASGNGIATLLLSSGKITAGDVAASIQLSSASYSGVSEGSIGISAGTIEFVSNVPNAAILVNTATGTITLGNASTGSAGSLSVNANGTPQGETAGTFTGTMPLSQTDSSSITITQTSATVATNQYGVPNNDGQAGTVYRLTAWGSGTQGSTQQALHHQLNAFGLTLDVWSMAGTDIAVSQPFDFRFVAEFMVTATGVTGTCRSFTTFTWAQSGTTTSSANAATSAAKDNGTINTTSSHTISMSMFWTSATGAPTVTCQGSMLERLGP